jgi:hypothetical protein
MAEITNFEKVLWGLSFFLKGVLVAQLLFRKNQRIYPYFFAYAVLTFLHSPVLFLSYRIWGFNSASVVDLAWGTQGLVIAARALAVAEICRRVVGRYRGVWALAWRMLLAIAGLVLFYSWAVARPGWQAVILNSDRGLELAIAGVIVMVFLFAQHYEIEVQPTDRYLAIGFFLFSCINVVNNTLLEGWLGSYETFWNLLGTLAFIASLTLWIWAVRERQEERRWQPEMLTGVAYRTLVPEINLRLKALNEQLGRFWYVEAKKQ